MSVETLQFELEVFVDQEADGRWFADIPSMPGVMAYGLSREAATQNAHKLALQVIGAQGRLVRRTRDRRGPCGCRTGCKAWECDK